MVTDQNIIYSITEITKNILPEVGKNNTRINFIIIYGYAWWYIAIESFEDSIYIRQTAG